MQIILIILCVIGYCHSCCYCHQALRLRQNGGGVFLNLLLSQMCSSRYYFFTAVINNKDAILGRSLSGFGTYRCLKSRKIKTHR